MGHFVDRPDSKIPSWEKVLRTFLYLAKNGRRNHRWPSSNKRDKKDSNSNILIFRVFGFSFNSYTFFSNVSYFLLFISWNYSLVSYFIKQLISTLRQTTHACSSLLKISVLSLRKSSLLTYFFYSLYVPTFIIPFYATCSMEKGIVQYMNIYLAMCGEILAEHELLY